VTSRTRQFNDTQDPPLAQGANLTGVRMHNERLVLSLIRRHGSLAKAEIARRSGLSPQTVSVIIRALEKDDLLIRHDHVRGRIGKPSVPMALNPDGAFSIGLKIGRRSADLILLDFTGTVRERLAIPYDYPRAASLLGFVQGGVKALIGKLSPDLRPRLAGIGFGEPFELWTWFDPVGGSKTEMEAWRDLNLARELEDLCALPVHAENDATAACSAENAFGRGQEFSDYLYFFVGHFAGGGVVLNNSVYRGRTGNAGALGSMPVRGDPRRQLIECASIFVLEARLKEAGATPDRPLNELESWDSLEAHVGPWLDEAARALAVAAASACAVIDFEGVIIDGSMPADIRERLVDRVRVEMAEAPLRGIDLPEVVTGTIGYDARAMGAASLPLFSRYLSI